MPSPDLFGTPRRVAVAQLVGGAALAAAAYVIIAVMHPEQVDLASRPAGWHRNTDLGGPIAIIVTLCLGTGLVFAYRGLVRLLGGARVDKINFDRITLIGLVYALGFALALGGALYYVVVVEKIRLFG